MSVVSNYVAGCSSCNLRFGLFCTLFDCDSTGHKETSLSAAYTSEKSLFKSEGVRGATGHVERASYLLCRETLNSVPAAVKMSHTGLGKEKEEEDWEEEKAKAICRAD